LLRGLQTLAAAGANHGGAVERRALLHPEILMSKSAFANLGSIVVPFFVASMFLGGCMAEVETGESEEVFDEEVAETDDGVGNVGESEEALKGKVTNPTGGGTTDPTNGCGYFCPWWAKDLSDCLIIPCDNGGGVWAP
jgi:hypothetical protein